MKSKSLRGAKPIHPRRLLPRHFALQSVACAVTLACWDLGLANPVGPQVAAGAASFASGPRTLTVTNTPGTIINWRGFSIGAGELTRFQQQSAASAVLNRVAAGNPSSILGTLSSNGRVFLVNPSGIVFGAGAVIDTAGFIASTLNIADRDFLQGKLRFEGGGQGALRNAGTIRASGDIFLVGPTIENTGAIRSDGGSVVLAAGKSVTISSPDAHGVTFTLQAPGDSAVNLGTIEATNAVGLFAGTLRHSGDIHVVGAGVDGAGRVVLAAQKDVTLDSTATITANGAAGGHVQVSAATGLANLSGTVEAIGAQGAGGRIEVGAPVVIQTGSLHADGMSGGLVAVRAGNLLQAGAATADGRAGAGGTVSITADKIIQTVTTRLSANGEGGAGGEVTVAAGQGNKQGIFSSAQMSATGAAGGRITVTGNEIVLRGAQLDASGDAGGGTVLVGGGWQGKDATVPNAQKTQVNFSTAIKADARASGHGGTVVVWSDKTTQFGGTISVRGGARSGDGGRVEVSGKDTLVFGGMVDASAPNGKAGTLLLDPANIFISAAGGGQTAFDLMDPNIGAGDQFGQTAVVLTNGNIVVAERRDDFGGTDAGAVHLFNGATGQLISTLIGTQASDFVGGDSFGGNGGVTALTNGNFVVISPVWNNPNGATSAGAVTWGSGVNGFIGGGGAVSAANSLVGTTASDSVGGDGAGGVGVIALTNGNYVVRSPLWSNGGLAEAGAVTWGNGASGIVGEVSAANSLVGTTGSDFVGAAVTALTNGNYVVNSPQWNNPNGATSAGAVTWGNGAGGTFGPVTAGNSLVGTTANDRVGSGGVIALGNGNYVVRSTNWDNGTPAAVDAGAVTFGNGTTGVSGPVDATNSLVGTTTNDGVGGLGVTVLTNGNYVVKSPFWDGVATNVGAATWGSGTSGVFGAVSAGNSLVGTSTGDTVSSAGVTALTNGHYVVASSNWEFVQGAATWGNGTGGTVGPVTAGNSLVGTAGADSVSFGGVTALTNGNYVVKSPRWDGVVTNGGAVTWGNGAGGTVGAVTAGNSLVGTTTNDFMDFGVTALTNGHYVVVSHNWNNGAATQAGAATWGNGTGGTVGPVTAGNSLVGTTMNDFVGSSGVTALPNGHYVVGSVNWNNPNGATFAGAVTWGNGTGGTVGPVDAGNSLVGTTAQDQVGQAGVTVLTNGNYVVKSPSWNNPNGATFAGAVTWGNGSNGTYGTSGTFGAVSATNSLVGTTINDQVGGDGFSTDGVTALTNGNYVVRSPLWNNGAATQAGAATWGNGTSGISGPVTAANSLVGTATNDRVGYYGVTALTNGNYVVVSSDWNNTGATQAGAVTWGNGTAGTSGAVSTANSIVGTTANDQLGSEGVMQIGGNRLLVRTAFFDGAQVNSGRVQIYDGSGGSFTNPLTFADDPSGNVTITPVKITAMTNAGTAVTLQANNDITLAASSNITTSASGAGGNLTLQAGRSIILNSNIFTDNGDLTLVANEITANGVVTANRQPGAAAITMAPGTSFNAGSGLLSMTIADGAGRTGMQALGGNLTSGSGVNLTGGRITLENNGGGFITLGTGMFQATATGLANATPAITIAAPGAGAPVSVNASLTSVSGAINVSAGSVIDLVQSATAGGDVTLNAGGDLAIFAGAAAGSGAALNIVAANAVFFGGTTAITGAYDVPGTTTVSGGTANFNPSSGTITAGQLDITGGTADFTVALNTPTLNLNNGGTLTGSGTVTVSSAFNWSKGVIEGSGTLVTQAGSTTTLSPGFNQTASLRGSRTWDNSGTVNFTPNAGFLSHFQVDDTTADGTAVFNNLAGGLFDLKAATSDGHIIGVGTFNNAGGEVRKSFITVATTSAVAPVFNNLGGVVNVNSGTLRFDAGGTDAGNYQVASGATLHFNAFNSDRSISGDIGGLGNVTFSKPLTGNTTYTLSGDYNVSGATTVNMSDLSTGDVNFTGTVTNLGTSYTQAGGVTNVSFTGITSGEATGFQSLTALTVNNGSLTFKDGTSFTNLATLTRAGFGTLDLGNASVALTSLTMSQGLLTSTGNISVSAVGAFTWSGGAIGGSGTLTTPPGLTTSMTTGFNSTASLRGSRIWNNSGTVNFTPNAGFLSFFEVDDTTTGGTAVFNNLAGGLFDLKADSNDNHVIGVGTFNNFGEVRKSLVTAAKTTGVLPTFNNQAGVVNVNSGTLRFDSGGTDAGNYQVESGATLHFNAFNSNRSISGDIGGLGNVTFSKPLTGNTTYTLSGDYDIAGATTAALNDLGIGALNFTGTVTNLGTSYTQSGNVTNVSFAGITSGEATGFQALNTLTVNSGSVTFKDGTSFSGLSSLTRAGFGTLDLANNSVSVSALTVDGGVLTGSGNVTVTTGGTFTWTSIDSSGTITGSGTLTTEAGSTTTLAPGFARTASLRGSRTWNNSGTVNFTPHIGTLSFFEIDDTTADGTAVFNNLTGALFNIKALTDDTHTIGVGMFNNAGEVRKSFNGTVVTSAVAPAFDNQLDGVVNVNNGTLRQDGALTQAGTINVATGATFRKNAGILNSGTLRGTGTFHVDTATLTNNGTVAPGASAGTLNVTGNYTQGTGGTLEIDVGGTAPGSFDVLAISGTATLAGTLNVNHVGFAPVVGNTFDVLTYAGFSGDFASKTFPPGFGYSATPGGTSYQLLVNTVTNTWIGTTGTWQTPGNWSLNRAPDAMDDAVIDVGGPGVTETITVSAAGQSARSVTAAENLAVTGGDLTLGTGASAANAALTVSGGAFTANGTLTAGSVEISGGTASFNGATNVVGALAVTGGTADFSVALTTPTINLSAGALSGTGTVTTDTLNWSNTSTISGPGTLQVNTTLAMNGTGAMYSLSGGRVVNNFGAATLSGPSQMDISGATFNNKPGASFTLADDSSVSNGGGGVFDNAGTLTKSGGAGTSTFAAALTNTGTVNADSGTLQLSDTSTHTTGTVNVATGATLELSGVTHDFNAGSTLTGLGDLKVAGGTANFNGTFGLANLFTVSGGTANFNPSSGAITATQLDITGGTANFSVALTTPTINLSAGMLSGTGTVTTDTLNWSDTSTISGTGTLNVNTTLAMSGAGVLYATIGGRVVNNFGAATLSGLNQLDIGGTFNNKAGASFTLTGGGTVSNGGGGGVFDNAGTLTKSGGAGTSNFTAALTNTLIGTVNANVGTLRLHSFPANAGTVNIFPGATLSTNGQSLINAAAGTIGGAGTLDLAGATLTNDGILRPGAAAVGSIGTLSIIGNLTQSATGRVNIEIGGTAAGAFDVVAVSGTANLGGLLNVTHVGGFAPVVGNTFDVLTYAGFSGDFASKTFPPGFGYSATPGGTSYQLLVNTVTNTWIGTTGTWQTPGNWSLNRTPDAMDDAVIDVGGPGITETITVSAAGQSARSVTAAENLAVTGGDLTLGTGASAANAALMVSGGAFTANGTLTAGSVAISGGTASFNGATTTPTIHLSAGTLSGTGTVTTDTLNWSNTSTISGAGTLNVNTTLAMNGAGAIYTLSGGRAVNNFGAATLSGPSQMDISGATFNNKPGASFTLADDSSVSNGGGGVFDNAGTLTKSGGAGTSTFAAALTNTATVNADSGTLQLSDTSTHTTGTVNVATGATLELSGVTHDFNAGSTLTGAGDLKVAGGTANFNGTFGLANLFTVSGGTANFNPSSGAITATQVDITGGTADFSVATNVTGALSVTGGVLGGSAAVTVGGALTFSDGTISNTGGVSVTGTTTVNGGAPQLSGTLTAGAFDMTAGALDIAGTGILTLTGASQITNATINNAGTVRYNTPGNDLLIGNGAVFNNQAGATFDIQADIFARGTGNGAFNNAGTVLKSGGTTDSGGFAATLPFNNNGGLLDSAIGALQLSGGGTHSGPFRTAGNGVDLNGGTHTFAAGSSFDGPFIFLNGGAVLNVSGNPTINSSLVWNGPSTITGGTLTVAPAGALDIVGTGSRTLIAATVNNQGTTNFSAADNLLIDGATLANSGTLSVTGAGNVLMNNGAVLNNSGTVHQAGASRLTLQNTAVINNDGTWNLSTSAASPLAGGRFNNANTFNNDGTTARTLTTDFNNTGLLRINAGALTLQVAGAANNPGLIDIASDAALSVSGTSVTNDGFVFVGERAMLTTSGGPVTNNNTTILGANAGLTTSGQPVTNTGVLSFGTGAVIATGGANVTNTSTGTLRGSGMLSLAGGVLVNNGTLTPGASPGTLTIDGNFTQGPGGILAIDVAGPIQGVEYDLLRVTGAASLDGALQIIQSGGYTPPEGQLFDFLTFGSRSGDFATFSIPPGFPFRMTGASGGGSPGPASSMSTMPASTRMEIATTSSNQVVVLSNTSSERATESESNSETAEKATSASSTGSQAEAGQKPRAAAKDCR